MNLPWMSDCVDRLCFTAAVWYSSAIFSLGSDSARAPADLRYPALRACPRFMKPQVNGERERRKTSVSLRLKSISTD
ncbi:hypothetical protein DNTS_018535 [Danionella cerebrum]|uniref:Uncharacterized protein n=1 Tax=Danionella cerebrum TaxID=2873325 RepID=A0A553QCP2_9TELE|nr:hypothetical protein DNTS_018535 [Danionella translucida]